MKKFLICSAAIVGMTSTAFAADLYEPVAEPVPYVATPAAFSWSGLYFGVHGGWGWADGSANYVQDWANDACDYENPICGAALALDPEGAFVGAQIGYQHQFGNWVLGIEADYSAASLNDSGNGYFDSGNEFSHVDLEVKQMATVQARIGYAMGQWLPFATIGWGWAEAERSVTRDSIGLDTSDSNWHDGFTVGAGVEYAINNNWSVKGEYRYFDGSKETYGVGFAGGTDVELDIHTVRFGINYRFN